MATQTTVPAATPAAFGALETSKSLSPEEIDVRAKELLAQLTLDEKVNLMSADPPFWPGLGDMFNGGYNAHIWPAGATPRLGIPGIRFSDGPRGIVMKGATTFPVSMARGAAWDVDLEERIGDVIGRELRALGGNFFGGVCINLLRHPAWGRAQETYGEDTHLLGEMGAALVRGVQRHVMACAKHYALNSMENARFKVDVTIDERALHEVYLPHFKRTVDAGVAAIMSAYNSVNGEWCGQNAVLLHDILKQTWGFNGFVMTDFIFGMRDAKKAALAGQDLEMPFQLHYSRYLKELVVEGEVPIERIDDACLRLLRQQVRFGQGRNPQDYGPETVGSEASRQLAREAAQKGIVLLKNEGGLLPLNGVKRLAVVGRLADTPNIGDAGSSNTLPAYVVTPLQGMRDALGGEIEIVYDDGSDVGRATAAVRGADAVLCVVGYTHLDEGELVSGDTMPAFAPYFPEPTPEEEPIVAALMQGMADAPVKQDVENGAFGMGGDRSLLTLHPEEEKLILAVAAANPKTVVAIMGGSAVITEAWRQEVPAMLMLWYPGMEGGHALADVLLGKVSPSGKLPCTFVKRAEDLPFYDKDATAITYDLWHGYRKLERDGVEPAFPFGFGLSYTTFEYSNLKLDKAELRSEDTLVATVDVTNTGGVGGDEVVQLYVAARGSAVERAKKELKAFVRVSLQPGETKTVKLPVPVADLAYYGAAGWVVEPIEYAVIVGRHALDAEALSTVVKVS
ncbi:MAG: glycoside hydrolase family 3 C-terminal domain-containing protein [Caldilineaceae bacterium]